MSEIEQRWRWWPSWHSDTHTHTVRFVGSTDRFDVFYDEDDNDYTLTFDTNPPAPGDPGTGLNFHVFTVDDRGVVDFRENHHDRRDLDPLNMCQLYQLLAEQEGESP